jgi:hypothetical protein
VNSATGWARPTCTAASARWSKPQVTTAPPLTATTWLCGFSASSAIQPEWCGYLTTWARWQMRVSEPAKARSQYKQALTIATRIGALPEKARVAEGLGDYHLCMVETVLGVGYLRQALEIYQQLGSFSAERVQRAIDGAGRF